MRVLASGLRFPEGPVALANGDLLLVEIARGTLTRVKPDGRIEVVATPGGGPNGLALGPDGSCYVCNNGGSTWHEKNGQLFPAHADEASYSGGRIERVDLRTGRVEVLYRQCEGRLLRGPNDLVFDAHGGFWFTDHGKTFARTRDRTGVFYAKADGSLIREALFPLDAPNGIGLSPDGQTLYVAETNAARLWAFELAAPGEIKRFRGSVAWQRGSLLHGDARFVQFDSLAVDSAGHVCVATIADGGITAVRPDGSGWEFVPLPDPLTTNLCFGGTDRRTAYVTLSSTGRLVAIPWPRPGLRLNYEQ